MPELSHDPNADAAPLIIAELERMIRTIEITRYFDNPDPNQDDSIFLAPESNNAAHDGDNIEASGESAAPPIELGE